MKTSMLKNAYGHSILSPTEIWKKEHEVHKNIHYFQMFALLWLAHNWPPPTHTLNEWP